MDNAEAFVKFAVAKALQECREDLEFFEKFYEEGLLAKLDESRLARWRDDPRFGLRRLLPHDGSPAHATTLVVSSRSPRALIAARTTLAAASAGVAAARTCFATRSSERASQTPSEQAMTFAPPGRSNARVHTTGVGST